jgi:hypothetical protein
MTVVSLDMAYCSFREVLAGLDTRLDTPPSIDSHHPDSGLARDFSAFVSKVMVFDKPGSRASLAPKPSQAAKVLGVGRSGALVGEVTGTGSGQ